MPKAKEKTFIVRTSSIAPMTKERLQSALEEAFLDSVEVKVVTATASAIRKLGDEQT
jgi:3-hydroxyisobutyrate dehydrogenase-like beta-hydroxyacid dehydrogenase